MKRKVYYSKLILIIPLTLVLILLLLFFVLSASAKSELASTLASQQHSIQKHNIKSSELSNVNIFVYLPLVFDPLPLDVELLDAWTSGVNGEEQLAHHVLEGMEYWVSGINNLEIPVSVSLKWSQKESCGESSSNEPVILYSETVTLEPGEWQISFNTLSPACNGVFAPIVQLQYGSIIQDLFTEFAANQYSTVLVNSGQGFDKCGLPEVWKMEAWWESSPYHVFNLYLGGINFACKNIPLDAVWVRKVAEQGWQFIQTWVGPQAPCTSYTHTMSWDSSTAYQQGKQEAQAAAEASYELGFFSDKIIYYDVEAYGQDDSACHKSVRSFLRGWTTRLHELGFKSGAYGAGCTSFMTEWASLSPPPDDVWIANYYTNYYDPNATVWNAPCISNNLWKNHQRIKQYTGGHAETWGGISITIDSNVLDGEITALDIANSTQLVAGTNTQIETYGMAVDSLGLINSGQGWVSTGGRLLISDDGGHHWIEITPEQVRILGVDFLNRQIGWLVGQSSSGELAIYKTEDGGNSWVSQPLPLEPDEAANYTSASLHSLNAGTIWMALKQRTGSSFSTGRLFFSGDGGISWQERVSPTGGLVWFLDTDHGWLLGGPAGDQLYYTQDGGYTWELETRDWTQIPKNESAPFALRAALAETIRAFATPPAKYPEGVVAIDYADAQHGWAATQTGTCTGEKGVPGEILSCEQHWGFLSTDDGGITWQNITLK